MQVVSVKEFCALALEGTLLVPTMGALHRGHLSLVQEAKRYKDEWGLDAKIVVSIFVNPTQFAAGEDLDKYPRMLEADTALLDALGCVDYILAPRAEDIYAGDEVVLLPPPILGYVLEGFYRPTHFSGVLTIVMKLINLAKARAAFFGQKDAQQLLNIEAMVRSLFMSVEIIGCPIVRDSDGLALSSRNAYLSKEGRERALALSASIALIKEALASGIKSAEKLLAIPRDLLGKSGVEIDYMGFYDFGLNEIDEVVKGRSIFLATIRIDGVRLLDNLFC